MISVIGVSLASTLSQRLVAGGVLATLRAAEMNATWKRDAALARTMQKDSTVRGANLAFSIWIQPIQRDVLLASVLDTHLSVPMPLATVYTELLPASRLERKIGVQNSGMVPKSLFNGLLRLKTYQ